MPTTATLNRSIAKGSKPDVLYVNFKPDSVLTVSRDRFETLTQHFGQDATFITHFALARLYADVQSGKLSNAKDVPINIPEGKGPLTDVSKALLRTRSKSVTGSRAFKPTQTLASAWGLKASKAR